MPKWHKSSGARVQLEAKPPTAQIGSSGGQLNFECRNRSMVPLDFEVRALKSSDLKIATATAATTSITSVHVGRRPDIANPISYASNTAVVGTWNPMGVGAASLEAEVDVRNGRASLLGSLRPYDDVQVKK